MNWETKSNTRHNVAEQILNNCEERLSGVARPRLDRTEGTFSLQQQMHPKIVPPTSRQAAVSGRKHWFGR